LFENATIRGQIFDNMKIGQYITMIFFSFEFFSKDGWIDKKACSTGLCLFIDEVGFYIIEGTVYTQNFDNRLFYFLAVHFVRVAADIYT